MFHLLALVVLFCFSFVLLFGAPYLPTLRKGRTTALQLLNLKPGQVLLELGCGDGRLLKEAAKQGIVGVGYELNPLLVVIAKLVTYKYRRQITIKWANYWQAHWPEANGIYVFLLKKYMGKLDQNIEERNIRNIKVLSYGFEIGGKKCVKKQAGFFLYKY